MKRSERAILTTHVGSLPRPAEVLELHRARDGGNPVDAADFDAKVKRAVSAIVRRQVEAGITVANDGEQSKGSYAGYLKDRVSGIELRERTNPLASFAQGIEARAFPGFYGRAAHPSAGASHKHPSCVGPLAWKDFELVEKDIANLKTASQGLGVVDVFMTAPSPTTAAFFQPNEYYKTHDEYRYAIAGVMQREYEAIAASGFVLQVDCPDLMCFYREHPEGTTLDEFRKEIAKNIEILNYATRNIAPDRMRMHVCCGAAEAPHTADPPLESIVDVLMTARPLGMTMVAANGRHEHEWKVWEDVEVPEGKVIIPGIIDSTTNIVEHPRTVAERIVRYAGVLGRENVIAGVDCGFDTLADFGQVVPEVIWAKLRSLADGAELATKQLW